MISYLYIDIIITICDLYITCDSIKISYVINTDILQDSEKFLLFNSKLISSWTLLIHILDSIQESRMTLEHLLFMKALDAFLDIQCLKSHGTSIESWNH